MPVPTVFRLLIVGFEIYPNFDRSDGHDLTRGYVTRNIQRVVERLRTLCARRIVSAPTTDRPM